MGHYTTNPNNALLMGGSDSTNHGNQHYQVADKRDKQEICFTYGITRWQETRHFAIRESCLEKISENWYMTFIVSVKVSAQIKKITHLDLPEQIGPTNPFQKATPFGATLGRFVARKPRQFSTLFWESCDSRLRVGKDLQLLLHGEHTDPSRVGNRHVLSPQPPVYEILHPLWSGLRSDQPISCRHVSCRNHRSWLLSSGQCCLLTCCQGRWIKVPNAKLSLLRPNLAFPISSMVATTSFSTKGRNIAGWWFQRLWKILVKMVEIVPNRDENKKYLKPPPSLAYRCPCIPTNPMEHVSRHGRKRLAFAFRVFFGDLP